MAAIVYVLCALTSSVCAGLLLREYGRNHTRLLLWSGVSFTALALSNVLVFADFVLFPDFDLALLRSALFFAATALLVYGLVRDAD
jgi:hypothetical protein